MNFPFFVARRYLFSKKSHNAINIISAISVGGVAIGTLALVVILSAFNGIEGLVESLYESFDPDIKITVTEGKTFAIDDVSPERLAAINGVVYAGPVIEESALITHGNQQTITRMKGMTLQHLTKSGIDSAITSGLHFEGLDEFDYAVLGMGVRHTLALSMRGAGLEPIKFYVPLRGKSYLKDQQGSFRQEYLGAGAEFSINADLDTRYTIVPYDFARDLLQYEKQVTSYELLLAPGTDYLAVKEEVQTIVGTAFEVKGRFEQNELLYKTSRTEKWFTFLILTFILVVATFNIIASLTMLVIDKKRDIQILMSMGCNRSEMRRIFFLQGMLISIFGALIGLVLGLALCFLQSEVGLVPLDGTIVAYYPVEVAWGDISLIVGTVLVIGFLASWLPVRYLVRRHAYTMTGLVN